MQTHTRKTALVSFIIASALMTPVFASAKDQAERPATPAPSASANKTVAGKVTERDAISITIDGTKYAVNDSTTFTKAGLPVKIDDIKVGDQVRLTVSDEGG